ncbi:MAG: FapA family protein [Planctomycetota bacterium]
MSIREVTVKAENIEEAMREGAILLNCKAENVLVNSSTDNVFVVTLKQTPAVFDLEISDDCMQARIAHYSPAVGDGKNFIADIIKNKLSEYGINYGINEEAITRAVDYAVRDCDISGTVIASGKLPAVASNAKISTDGNINFPVLPGMKICSLLPASAAEPGITIKGDEVQPPEVSKEIKDAEINVQEGAQLAKDKTFATATVYGLASVSPDGVEVKPLYEISSDKMEVTAVIYNRDCLDDEIDEKRLIKAFSADGIIHGYISENLTKALNALVDEKEQDQDTEKSVNSSDNIENILLFTGTQPRKGRDAKLSLFFEENQTPGEADEYGRIDYHERSVIRNVKAGQQLASVIPPEKGTPGKDVYGNEIPAEDGRELVIQPGDNVNISQDKLKFFAETDGILLIKEELLSVTDILEIKGDVDFNSGNVHIDKGSVSITGTVKTDFTVEVADSIIVGESIEGADVKAGGDIEVKHGLLMQSKGCVNALGNISALFAENSNIVSGGDLIITNDITNCNINTKGKVIATKGKGKIMGGIIFADGGIEVNELGSDMGVATEIHFGGEPENISGLNDEKNILQKNISKIERVIGTADPKKILLSTPVAKRKAIAEIIKAKMAALSRISEIENISDEIMENYRESLKVRVNVLKVTHPGVKIFIAGKTISIDKDIQNCSIYYDAANSKIRIGPLR